MNFLQAAEIAKSNKGSILHRGESGQFIVRLADGRVITSPAELHSDEPRQGSSEPMSVNEQVELKSQVERLFELRKIDRREIEQLRGEVNDLKSAISRIPESEWKKYEEAQQLEAEKAKAEEASRLVDLAKSNRLTHFQLVQIIDNATKLGIDPEDLKFLKSLAEKSSRTPDSKIENSIVIFSDTDGH